MMSKSCRNFTLYFGGIVSESKDPIEILCYKLLQEIGEDPTREGLVDTPKRFARWWRDFSTYKDNKMQTTFTVSNVDQMVIVRGMKVWSLCEHHLLPFWCDITVGHIAEKSVLGLSKYARIAHQHASKLQMQERLVTDIANDIKEYTKSEDVAVIAKGEHLCMAMRGIKTEGEMISSVMSGKFRSNVDTRAEFISLAGVT
mgnify:CR=1 FL=1